MLVREISVFSQGNTPIKLFNTKEWSHYENQMSDYGFSAGARSKWEKGSKEARQRLFVFGPSPLDDHSTCNMVGDTIDV